MSILDVKFVQGFIRMCNDGWEQGWHERNGGNLSYRIKPEELDEVKNILKKMPNGDLLAHRFLIFRVNTSW